VRIAFIDFSCCLLRLTRSNKLVDVDDDVGSSSSRRQTLDECKALQKLSQLAEQTNKPKVWKWKLKSNRKVLFRSVDGNGKSMARLEVLNGNSSSSSTSRSKPSREGTRNGKLEISSSGVNE